MAQILIGSSNVYRFYDAAKFTTAKKYKMINCTSLEVFKAKMDDLNSENKEIVISVIELYLRCGQRGSRRKGSKRPLRKNHQRLPENRA